MARVGPGPCGVLARVAIRRGKSYDVARGAGVRWRHRGPPGAGVTAVKMVLLVFHAEYEDTMRDLFERLALPGFTEVQRVFGSGEAGRRFGIHGSPGHDTLIFSVLPDREARGVVQEIKALKASLDARRKRPGGIKVFVLPVEEMA